MDDLKDFKIPAQGWSSWIKHNSISLTIILAAMLFVIWFVGSKMAYVVIEDNKEKRTYKAGIRVLEQQSIPDPDYVHSQPQLVSLVCADGTKLFVTQMTTVIVGECD